MPKAVMVGQSVAYWCPGCRFPHAVPAARWHYNGNAEAPTLSPSVRHFYTIPETGAQHTTCHYFVRDGRIEYCGDSAHALAGQTVPLLEVDQNGYPQATAPKEHPP